MGDAVGPPGGFHDSRHVAPAFPGADGNGSDRSSWISGQVEAMAAAWARGNPLTAAEILARHPALSDESAIRLIYEEICLRRDSGQNVATTEIVGRFPRFKDELEVLLGCDRMLRPLFRPAPLPEIGEELGPFRLLRELGRGASGKTFLAAEPALANRLVVLKVTPGDQEEHLSLARLQHPHVIPLFYEQAFNDRGLRALCMPYLGGTSLARIIDGLADFPPARRSGLDIVAALDRIQTGLPPAAVQDGPCRRFLERANYTEAICWMTACLADGLEEAHVRGLVHMDVKPSNILIAADGTPMLLDFHLARRPVQAGERGVERIGGTPGWMAPEQRAAVEAAGQSREIRHGVDHRADIYGLGLVLRDALIGPAALEDTAACHDWRRGNRNVSVGLADIVRKCISVDPADRYGTARALADDLRRHLNHMPLAVAANRSLSELIGKWVRRHPLSLSRRASPVAAMIALAAIIVLAMGYFRDRAMRVDEARLALVQGEKLRVDGRYDDATTTLGHALAKLDSLPAVDELRAQITDRLRAARVGEKLAALHDLAESIRLRFGITLPADREARRLARLIRAIWNERDALTSSVDPTVRADLADLAVTWAELELGLAGSPPSDEIVRDARTVLDQATKLCGDTPRLVQLRQRLPGEKENAISAFVATTTADHYDLGRQYLRAERFQEAAAEFRRVLRSRPQDFWSNFYEGLCAERLGNAEESAASFRVCIALQPKNAECYYNRAVAIEKLGRAEGALADYERAIELDPGLTSALLNRGILLFKLGRHEEAVGDLRRALTAELDQTTRGRLHYALAMALRAGGNRESALAAADAARACGHPEAQALQDRLRDER
jgi:serine/threonine protein kinase/Flp pilus assembly protein TadD